MTIDRCVSDDVGVCVSVPSEHAGEPSSSLCSPVPSPKRSKRSSGGVSMQQVFSFPRDAPVFFQPHEGAWCGVYALNNYMGDPYVTRTDCMRAAVLASSQLSKTAGGEREDIEQHIHPETGFLSIDVMNVLGASVLGIHVSSDQMYADCLFHSAVVGVMANCHSQHWAVFKKYHCSSGTTFLDDF